MAFIGGDPTHTKTHRFARRQRTHSSSVYKFAVSRGPCCLEQCAGIAVNINFYSLCSTECWEVTFQCKVTLWHHVVRHPRCVFINYNWINELSNTTIWWLDICCLLHRYQLHVSALMAIFRLID